MAMTSVIKQPPAKELRLELHSFISNASKPVTDVSQLDQTRKILTLVKNAPTSRVAVFNFFGSLLDLTTYNHLIAVEEERPNQPSDDALVDEFRKELCGFVNSQPESWSLFIAEWIIDLLGTLSSKYSSRGKAPVHGTLNDSLQQWISCRTTGSLVDIAVSCIKKLKGTEASGNCIIVLLDVCVRDNPHFDWAVAYIGGVFPEIVISKVLQGGLDDFTKNQGNTNLPRLKSVVATLVHLCGSHQHEVDKAMKELFLWSLEPSEGRDIILKKNAIVPYLFHLASVSPILLSRLCRVTIQIMKPDILERLAEFGVEWSQCSGSSQVILDLAIHLILSVTDSADQILRLVLDATSLRHSLVSSVAEEILELLIQELETLVRSSTAKIPFLDSVQNNMENLFPMLLCDESVKYLNTVAIFTFIGDLQPYHLPKCIAFILLRSKDDEHLAAVVKFSQGHKSSTVLSPAVAAALGTCETVDDKARVWTNLNKLLKWEASGTLISLPILEAITFNLTTISSLLCEEKDIKVAHTIAELLRKAVVETKQKPNVQLSRSIVKAAIAYFHMCLRESEDIEEIKGIRAVTAILKKLSQSSACTRVFAVRELLESSLFRPSSILFGAVPVERQPFSQAQIRLMDQNNKQGFTALMGQRHSSISHAGIIGNGKRKLTPTCPISHDKVIHNTTLLLKVLKSCCSCENNQETLDAVIAIALQVVELVSPDVMYNGLPWPEEEFCKVTVERDLHIRRILDKVPVVWSLLTFIAHYRPALCYCSVILRAMMATLIVQWCSMSQQGRGPGHSKQLIETTNKILQIMALGQLLPPPLNALGDVIPHISPNQVVQILRDCVWNYMRDNVPSPALFTRDPNGNMWRDTASSRPPKLYTETLRHVMLNNVSALGHLYNTLFVKPLEGDDDDD